MDNEYRKYLKSKEWELKKIELFKTKPNRCEECSNTNNIEVHHKTYENIMNEKLSDLQVLCRGCHMAKHNIKTQFQLKRLAKLKKKKKRKRRLK